MSCFLLGHFLFLFSIFSFLFSSFSSHDTYKRVALGGLQPTWPCIWEKTAGPQENHPPILWFVVIATVPFDLLQQSLKDCITFRKENLIYNTIPPVDSSSLSSSGTGSLLSSIALYSVQNMSYSSWSSARPFTRNAISLLIQLQSFQLNTML